MIEDKLSKIPENIVNLFFDIGAGICNAQKLSESEHFNYDMSKVKQYKPKTKILDIIATVLKKSNYREDYNWQHEMIFKNNSNLIEVVRYDINTSDWCIIKVNGKQQKITKKRLREMYETRSNVL